MINPHLLKPGYSKQISPIMIGGKFYRPRVELGQRAFHCKRIYKRASDAQSYAERLIARWMRLYDAAKHDERVDAMHEMDAMQASSVGPA